MPVMGKMIIEQSTIKPWHNWCLSNLKGYLFKSEILQTFIYEVEVLEKSMDPLVLDHSANVVMETLCPGHS